MSTLDTIFTFLSGVGTFIVGAATFGALAFGVYQYRAGQKWQKVQVILSLIDSFRNDKQIQIACRMLDWDERWINHGSVRFLDEGDLHFTNGKLVKALKTPPMDTERFFGKDGVKIRDAFDAFFDFFEILNAFEKNKLLNFDDYRYFYYYLDMIRDVEGLKGDPKNKRSQRIAKKLKMEFDSYLTNYNFEGALALLRDYERLKNRPNIVERIMKSHGSESS
jgi:hypothetical protein